MLKVLLSAALVAMMMAGPAHARGERFEPPPSGVFEFVGFSTGTVDGSVGVLAMHAACQTDFGADTRMCTSEEYFRSPGAADPGSDSAWVHGAAAVSFFSNVAAQNCNGWNDNSSTRRGLTVQENGIVNTDDSFCNVARPVTCCTRLK